MPEGYDGVEFTQYIIFLLHSFSKYYNKCRHEYGGSAKTEHVGLEIIDGIRKVVRPEFVVGIRICGD